MIRGIQAVFRKVSGLLFLAGLILGTFSPAQADDLSRELNSRYSNKVLVLRGFSSGDRLAYDASGLAGGYSAMGDWTSDGLVLVDQIRISDGSLRISARRLLVSAGKNGFQFYEIGKKNKKPKKWNSVEIQAALPWANPSLDQLESLLEKIFLTPQDSIAELVPEYWNPCVREGLDGKNANCRFSPDIVAVPGIAPRPASSEPLVSTKSDSKSESSKFPSQLGADGKHRSSVTPPSPIYRPEPAFNESARVAKCEGNVTLALIVDTNGNPTNIRIDGPLGCGLDANAVQAVGSWRFKPAMKDGKPVRVPIHVQVDFHLY